MCSGIACPKYGNPIRIKQAAKRGRQYMLFHHSLVTHTKNQPAATASIDTHFPRCSYMFLSLQYSSPCIFFFLYLGDIYLRWCHTISAPYLPILFLPISWSLAIFLVFIFFLLLNIRQIIESDIFRNIQSKSLFSEQSLAKFNLSPTTSDILATFSIFSFVRSCLRSKNNFLKP